jgi:predicted nucleic acid-binding protein
VILLDTSVLIDALAGERVLAPVMRRVTALGEQLTLCAPVLYEWQRGPRTALELARQEELLPGDDAWPFGPAEARVAAALYGRIPRPRQRELDIAVAACALTHAAALWTLNIDDFVDMPGLSLYVPPAAD